MSSYIKHQYVHRAEALHPRVDVTWGATYRVGNGRWRPVMGTITTPGVDTTLKIIEGRTVLLD